MTLTAINNIPYDYLFFIKNKKDILFFVAVYIFSYKLFVINLTLFKIHLHISKKTHQNIILRLIY